MPLDLAAAREAVSKVARDLGLDVATAAAGIIRIANEHMARALRVMSVQRGVDPAELTLVCFGGAGGLHVCALAQELGMHQAMVPVHAGVLSALGMLVAAPGREVSRTLGCLLQDVDAVSVQQQLDQLAQDGREQMARETRADEVKVFASLDCRYQGQSYSLNIPCEQVDTAQLQQAFHTLHQERYGHRVDAPVELVNLRVRLEARVPGMQLPMPGTGAQAIEPEAMVSVTGYDQRVPIYTRGAFHAGDVIVGPAIITEDVSTTFVDDGWRCQADKYGNLLLERLKV